MDSHTHTRGQRHLQEFLGKDKHALTRSKKASDVVPVMRNKKDNSGNTASASASDIAPAVIAYLQARQGAGAVNKLSTRQMKVVQALAAPASAALSDVNAQTSFLVKRSRLSGGTDELADMVALAALQRRAVMGDALEGCTLFVLAENAEAAQAVKDRLTTCYGLEVLLLDAETRYPSFSLSSKRTERTSPARGEKHARTPSKADATATEDSEAVASVIVSTPDAFMATEYRSNIWKFVGAFVIAITTTSSESAKKAESSLVHRLTHGTEKEELSRHRWRCLGHATLACILSVEDKYLAEPALDWLTTLRHDESHNASQVESPADKKKQTKESALAVPQLREPVHVHFSIAEGIHRFGFLLSLVRGLSAGKGLVIHFATKEGCSFMYDVLYAMMDDMPSNMALFSDYEGASQFSAVATAEGRERLCDEFNEAVESGTKAAVMLSCYGLAPHTGSVFLQYDLIPDAPNYNQFISDTLTPGAVVAPEPDAAVVRDATARSRKRSLSPTPRKKSKLESSSSQQSADAAPRSAKKPAMYRHIIILLRQNEVEGALDHLRRTSARHNITYMPLPHKPSQASYLLLGEKLRSINKKLFAVQNAAYHAYKATMTAYCTMGPKNLYNEKKVNLEHVAEEFGYTELPLLDLRLKDTVFRPKEDLYKAARKKQAQNEREYKKFADKFIIGEQAEEHIPDTN